MIRSTALWFRDCSLTSRLRPWIETILTVRSLYTWGFCQTSKISYHHYWQWIPVYSITKTIVLYVWLHKSPFPCRTVECQFFKSFFQHVLHTYTYIYMSLSLLLFLLHHSTSRLFRPISHTSLSDMSCRERREDLYTLILVLFLLFFFIYPYDVSLIFCNNLIVSGFISFVVWYWNPLFWVTMTFTVKRGCTRDPTYVRVNFKVV